MNHIIIKTGLIFSLVLLGVSCQKQNSQTFQFVNDEKSSQILGGELVKSDDMIALSTVGLVYVDSNDRAYASCTGTLISPDLILTASHCLAGIPVDNLRISFNVNILSNLDPQTMFKVENFKTHPLFNGHDQKNDVALIKLSQKAPGHYKPVKILSAEFQLTIGMPMLLAGFGLVNDETGEETTGLRKVIVPLAKILETIVVTDQTKMSGACNGDSGGPAYLQKEHELIVYGITRGPHEMASDCHHFGEYTYASKFEKFILETAAELKAEQPIFFNPIQ